MLGSNLSEYVNSCIDYKSITEATFYGKNENLIKGEAIIEKIIKLAKVNKGGTDEYQNLLDELGELLATTFGFSSVEFNKSVLSVYALSTNSSAMTPLQSKLYKYTQIVIGNRKTYVADFNNGNEGVKFQPGTKYDLRIIISAELFYYLTAQEIMAVILHEIGHNFYVGPIREFGEDAILYMTMPDVLKFVTFTATVTFMQEGIRILDKFLPVQIKGVIAKAYNLITNYLAPFQDIVHLYQNALTDIFLYLHILKIAISPGKVIQAFIGYDYEKYSDTFAAAYGYGAELSSALYKMTQPRLTKYLPNKKDIGLYDFLITAYKIPLWVTSYLIDPHPQTSARLMNNIRYMEAVKTSGMIRGKKGKAQFEQSLKEMYELRDEVKSYKGPEISKQAEKFASILQDITQISDLKDITSFLIPKWTKYKNIDM